MRHNTKVFPDQWQIIRTEYENNPNMRLSHIAEKFGVTRQLVSHKFKRLGVCLHKREEITKESKVIKEEKAVFKSQHNRLKAKKIYYLLAKKGVVENKVKFVFKLLKNKYSMNTIGIGMSKHSRMNDQFYKSIFDELEKLPDFNWEDV